MRARRVALAATQLPPTSVAIPNGTGPSAPPSRPRNEPLEIGRHEVSGLFPCPARSSEDPLLRLAAKVVRGDHDAELQLVRALTPVLRRSLVPIVRAAELDDALQEALFCVLQALPRFRRESTFLHFAVRIAVRSGLSHRRNFVRRARHLQDIVRLDQALAAQPTQPDDEVLDAFRRKALERLVSCLPCAQAEAVVLRVLRGCSLEEVAVRTKASVNTVRTRIRLARQTLRRRIETDPALAELLRPHSTDV